MPKIERVWNKIRPQEQDSAGSARPVSWCHADQHRFFGLTGEVHASRLAESNFMKRPA